MNVLLSVLIVAIGPVAPIHPEQSVEAAVFNCVFDELADGNFDRWPDGWSRRRGPGFPRYVGVEIVSDSSASAGGSLRIDLDGGAAAAYSPTIPVDSLFDYVLEAIIRTEGLDHDRAFLSLTLLDNDRHRLKTHYSDRIRHSGSWQPVCARTVNAMPDEARFAVIGLHLEPTDRADLTGSAMFDDVRLIRLPRISLSTGTPTNIFAAADQVSVFANTSGFGDRGNSVRFQLEDSHGNTIAKADKRMTVDTTADARPRTTDDTTSSGDPVLSGGLVGSAEWSPPIPGPGFYRVRAELAGHESTGLGSQLTLVVIEPARHAPGSEFGWTLPRAGRPLAQDELIALVEQAAIGWVKYPFWHDMHASDNGLEQSARFSQRLLARNIELVGMLSDPPVEVTARFDDSRPPLAAEIFGADAQAWSPSLEPILMRMSAGVRWWQLGPDRDMSFVGYPDLTQTVSQIKMQFDQIGHNVNLGFGWDLQSPPPYDSGAGAPWRFLSLLAEPPLDSDRLGDYLAASQQPGLARWVVIDPLPRGEQTEEVRAVDLFKRMTAAKIAGAEAIFLADPISTTQGLFNDDGTPGELFLPWRTTALMLGSADYLGSIELPGGSQNRLFARGNDAVLVVWNEQPAVEEIYLGADVRQVDLWGRASEPPKEDSRSVIATGPVPTFITGVDKSLARWRQQFSLARDNVPSVFGRPQENGVELKNPTTRTVSGRLTLTAPEDWRVTPESIDFQLAPGELFRHPLAITLPYNAANGRARIRADFQLADDPPVSFSTYRQLEVGSGDVRIEVTTSLNHEGELEVLQRFVNNTDLPINFRCQLFAPGRTTMRTDILDQNTGDNLKTYRLADGQQLVDRELWLRAEEIGGQRMLNYRFKAMP